MAAIIAWMLAHGTELLSLAQTILLLFHGKQLIASNKADAQSPSPGDLVK